MNPKTRIRTGRTNFHLSASSLENNVYYSRIVIEKKEGHPNKFVQRNESLKGIANGKSFNKDEVTGKGAASAEGKQQRNGIFRGFYFDQIPFFFFFVSLSLNSSLFSHSLRLFQSCSL